LLLAAAVLRSRFSPRVARGPRPPRPPRRTPAG
jgi:hypothetical protein